MPGRALASQPRMTLSIGHHRFRWSWGRRWRDQGPRGTPSTKLGHHGHKQRVVDDVFRLEQRLEIDNPEQVEVGEDDPNHQLNARPQDGERTLAPFEHQPRPFQPAIRSVKKRIIAATQDGGPGTCGIGTGVGFGGTGTGFGAGAGTGLGAGVGAGAGLPSSIATDASRRLSVARIAIAPHSLETAELEKLWSAT